MSKQGWGTGDSQPGHREWGPFLGLQWSSKSTSSWDNRSFPWGTELPTPAYVPACLPLSLLPKPPACSDLATSLPPWYVPGTGLEPFTYRPPSLLSTSWRVNLFIPILQMRLNGSIIKQLTQGHPASQWLGWDLNLSLSHSQSG